jgi:hypothetical protein
MTPMMKLLYINPPPHCHCPHHHHYLSFHYSFKNSRHQIKHQTDGDFSSKHAELQFIKRYGDVLKLIVSLNKSSIHTDIVGQIEDLIDDTNDETAIQHVLKRNRHQCVYGR